MQLRKANINEALNNPEICKTIPDYDLYKATYNGLVYSQITGKFLKPGLSKATGYLSVVLRNKKGKQTHTIHRLVGINFLEPVPGKTKINHKSGNKLFNHVDNLEWSTSAENNIHAITAGLRKVKCTPEIIAAIVSNHVRGDKDFGAKQLAKRYGLNKCTVHAILNAYKYNSHASTN